MILQCYDCHELFHEKDGVMCYTQELAGFGVMVPLMIFKCRNCMSEKSEKKLNELLRKT